MASRAARRTPLREALVGVRTVLRGFRAWGADPRAMLLGVLPGLASAAILGTVVVVVAINADGLGSWVGRSLGGEGWWGDLLAVAAAIAAVVAGGLVAVLAFATLTLAIGQPFFEAISRRVDAHAGFGPADGVPEEPWARALVRGLREGLLTLVISVGVSLLLLAVGLIPVIGSATSLALGALVGGRLLAIELTAYPLARRGILSRTQRIRVLRPHRARVVAFGASVFVMFLIPLGAIIAMPAAIAGATILSREILALSSEASPSEIAAR